MKIQMKKLASALIGVALATSATTLLARDYRSADNQPKDFPTVMAVRHMGEVLAKDSGGKQGVKVFSDGQLGSEKDTIEQVKIGAIDMVRVNIANFLTMAPETQTVSLPFIFRSKEHHLAVINGPIGDKILASLEKVGYIGLAMYDSGARSLYAKKPIKNLNDTKGMKIRVQPSDLWVDLVKAMGATPTPIPYAEVYMALKTGLVDAAENNYPSFDTAKHFESAPYYSETFHVMSPEVLVFSKKVWDTLKPEEQQNIRKAAKESVAVYNKLWGAKENASKEIVVKGGAKIIPAAEVDHKGFVDAQKPVWDKYANTPELKALVQEIVNTK